MTDEERLKQGYEMRRAVLGNQHVDHADATRNPFNDDFQSFITRCAWGEVWQREHLDRRTRSLITIAMLIAMNREAELKMHLKAALNNGVTREEIREVIFHSAIYCGVPAANSTFNLAQEVIPFGEE
jgi:4-carboxymuconolactone decarboxylase